MKNILLTFILILFIVPLHSYDFMSSNKSMLDFIDSYDVYNNELYFVQEFEFVSKISKEDIRLTTDGYNIISHPEHDVILIPGEKVFTNFNLKYYASDKYKEGFDKNYPQYSDILSSINIKNITASSYYTETISGKTIEYKAEYLLDRYTKDCKCHSFNFNNMSTPWVDGVPGNGTGEIIEVTFEESNDFIVILNGYIDPSRTYLFKENGRLKDIRITSTSPEFEILYTFDDYVYYADIEFPEKTDKVKIEIMDVYNGSKYNDTCISGIIGKSMNVDSDISDFVVNFE